MLLSGCFILAAVLGLCTASRASSDLSVKQTKEAVTLSRAGKSLALSLTCPKFLVQDQWVGGQELPLKVTGNLSTTSGGRLEAAYSPIAIPGSGQLQIQLTVQWSPKEGTLRKWARCRMMDTPHAAVLKEVVLEQIDGVADADCTPTVGQSYPVFLPGYFAGVEYPIAAVRKTNSTVSLGHKPGTTLIPGQWFESRKTVYTAVPVGEERAAFKRYVAAHRPGAGTFHVNYNSWWTSPVPYTEKDILGLVNTFKTKMYDPYKVSFDTFTVDLGWSDPLTMWQVNAKSFPNKCRDIISQVTAMKSHMGFWISPSNCYSPQSVDTDWAAKNGFETYTSASGTKLCCLAGHKYADAFRAALVKLVTEYRSCHFKFDGYVLECPSSEHGHLPGDLSQDATAEGLLAAVADIRKHSKNTWIETTCMGWNGSPWWLFYVDSVIGTYGDDAPYGRVPCPVYRESSTTARDYYNLQGAEWLVMPIVAQEVLGIIHQTPEPLTNDAVDVVMRGHMFMPVYMNPAYMNDARWKSFSDLISWARANAKTLQQTTPLQPVSWQNGKAPKFDENAVMPREPYGYAHCSGDQGLIHLRNPWITNADYELKLDTILGLDPSAKNLNIVSIYPEPRLYARSVKYGDKLRIPIAPYETLVLQISKKEPAKAITDVHGQSPSISTLSVMKNEKSSVVYNSSDTAFGPDWTSLVGSAKSGTRVQYGCDVTISAPDTELLILNEAPTDEINCPGSILIDGVAAKPVITGSASGWSATGLPKHEHWMFLRVPLPQGKHSVSIDIYPSAGQSCSAWIWAKKPGGNSNIMTNLLPQPEIISLQSQCLIDPFKVDTVDAPVMNIDRPVSRINGVYLDTLLPSSVKQGWGTLQKNQSVWEKPMMIGGVRYLRGLGTHAEAKIVYDLDGKYRRFQSYVGADGNTSPTVTFTIKLDGVVAWESGLMTQADQAKFVDIDVTGKKQLELVVGDGGNGFVGDHADFADAMLLR